ncbi:hypothetical protein NB311A_00315 [Nitrobacter sp. Nb-311A]|nr:hypothetical protein NB311A_00315 [Nitrobacter sp. Nb-311A]
MRAFAPNFRTIRKQWLTHLQTKWIRKVGQQNFCIEIIAGAVYARP